MNPELKEALDSMKTHFEGFKAIHDRQEAEIKQ